MSPGQTKSIEAAAQAMEERSTGPALGPALVDTAVLTGATAALLTRFGAGDSGSTLAAYHEGSLLAHSVADPPGGLELSAELQAGHGPVRADRLQSADPGDIAALLGRSPEQIVGIPLGTEGAQPAVLYLAFDQPVQLDDRYVRFLTAVAAQTARALFNKSLVNDLASQVEQSGRLLEIARIGVSNLELDQILIRLVETAARLTGVDRASIWLLSRDGANLLPSAMYGVDEDFLRRWKADVQSLNEELLSREALADGKPVVVLDAAADPRTDKAAVEYFGDKSILIAPLTAAGRPLGTLYLNSVVEHHDYSEKDIQIALSVAGEAALAIDYARIRTESEARGDRLRTSFRRLGDVLATGESLDQTLQLVVKIMVDIVRARGVAIALLGEDRTGIEIRAASGCPELPGGRIPFDLPPDGDDGLGGLSPQKCHNNFRALRTMLNKAVKWGYLARSPLDPVDPPRVPRKEVQALSEDEVRTLIEFAGDTAIGRAIRVAVCTGMRRAELLGLRWSDIDWDGRTLHVQQTVYRLPRRGFFHEPPKNDGSARQIFLTPTAIRALTRQRAKQGENKLALGMSYDDNDLVFAAPNGGP